MSLVRVQEYFKKFGIEDRIIVLEHDSSATVLEAANALHCEPARIAKTLSFDLKDRTILVITAGDARVDNQKFRSEFDAKANMVKHDEVLARVGHEPGGVCPFGINEGVEVYLDKTLKAYHDVYPACGSSNSAINLTIEELEKYSNYIRWVDVCKEN